MYYTTTIFLVGLVTVIRADFYDSKYDNFDIQPLLENDRILLGYTRCFVDQGPCTPDAKDFKKAIPEALQTSCGKCTTKQRELIRTVIAAVIERNPETWKLLVDKYDNEKKYRDNFEKFLKGE